MELGSAFLHVVSDHLAEEKQKIQTESIVYDSQHLCLL